MEKNKTMLLPIVIGGSVTVIAIAVGSVVLLTKPNDKTSSVSTTVTTTTSPTTKTNAATTTPSMDLPTSNKAYKDGVYTAKGSYVSPAGNETISVKLTIKDNKVTSVEVDNSSITDRQSKNYSGLFKSGISGVVVGKDLDSAKVNGSVNGSSLTGDGFNQALESIKTQAKS